MADLSPGAIGRRARTKGGVVTIVTVLGLVAGIGLTWLGLGAKDHAAADYDASAWLWSSVKSEMARVNGLTGRVDTRMGVPSAAGHTMQVSQSDRFLVLRDVNSGHISAIDLTTLQVSGTAPSMSGLGVTVALDRDSAFLIDPAQGIVRQINPSTLAPVGDPVQFPQGITGGTFDGRGRLWIAIPSEGTVAAIVPIGATSTGGGVGGGGPSRVKTVAVADRSHDLVVSTLDSGVAVLDRTNGRLTTVVDDKQSQVNLDLQGAGALPQRTAGPDVPVTVVDERHVFVVTGDKVHDFTVPGSSARLKPAVAWSGRFYVADEANGAVYVLDREGKLVDTIPFKEARGAIDLEVRENRLFINAPNAATARVVDDEGHVKIVDKFANDVLGGDPPPVPPPPPPPKPPVGKPGAVRNLKAVAGNTQARVTWSRAADNGSAVTKYIVEGNGQTFEVGAAQRSLVITGLVNGEKYAFTVWAVNAKGAGPQRTSNTVTPSFEVPDAPLTVKALAKPDGTVSVTWDKANGQGHAIARYEVTATSSGASAPIGSATGTSLTVKAGDLEYGTQYSFSVIAVNDIGVASKSSPASDSVVPFTKPAAVKNLSAATVTSAKGTIQISWTPGSDNGRQITEYRVTVGGVTKSTTALSMTWAGLADGATVTVTVVAVNEAGAGVAAKTAAKTLAVPVRSAETPSATYSAVSVAASFTGDAVTCKLTVAGQASVTNSSCSNGSKLTVNVNRASTTYSWTLTVGNAAGSYTASGSARTGTISATAQCNGCAVGVWEYKPNSSDSITQSSTYVGGVYSDGKGITPVCKKTGVNINSAGENNNKQSSWWVMVNDPYYLPYAYTDMSSTELGYLPGC
jgi:hypothetical protein